MKVKAIATDGKDLSKYSLRSFHNPEEYFNLKIGGTYIVYGINLWDRIIHYLTLIEGARNPFWSPAELFEIIDNRLPKEWYFKFYGYEKNSHVVSLVNAVWGYKELALSQKHYDELIEREGDALDIFRMRQKEIDKFHETVDKS
jgi:hypothetical protein